MPEKKLPYGKQSIDEADVKSVADTLLSDYLTTGPKVSEFEAALCAHSGAKYAIAVNSGTAALHCAYYACGLGSGDSLVTSPMTFAATTNAALYLGARPIFADIDPDTGLIDPESVRERMDSRTRLIVPIDFAGQPADYTELREISDETNCLLVADAAHSMGATYNGEKVGVLADATCTSFHPVKPCTTGEGGAILTSEARVAEVARSFRTHGIEHTDCHIDDGPWVGEQRHLGFNYRLTDIQCALGISQLPKLEGFIKRRRRIADRYEQAFTEAHGFETLTRRSNRESGWHLYVIKVLEPIRRKKFFEALREAGILVQVHYIPVYWHPYYRSIGYQKGLCPKAEDFYSRILSIPIFPAMSDDDVDFSIETIQRVAKEIL